MIFYLAVLSMERMIAVYQPTDKLLFQLEVEDGEFIQDIFRQTATLITQHQQFGPLLGQRQPEGAAYRSHSQGHFL